MDDVSDKFMIILMDLIESASLIATRMKDFKEGCESDLSRVEEML
jgi:hypothetical protein